MDNQPQWLPLDQAAQHFGYAYKNSFTNRLRQLRRQGFVVDKGSPPPAYIRINRQAENLTDKIILFWPHSQTALLHTDAPPHLLNSKRGKRIKVKETQKTV